MSNQTKILNFFGGPNVGKTSTANYIFSFLKETGKEVELAPEVAKELVWDGALSTLEDVIYVFGEQHRRIYRLMNQVEYIVADGPLLCQLPYIWYDNRLNKYNPTEIYSIQSHLQKIIVCLAKRPENINFNIARLTNLPYQQVGRVENLSEAQKVDNEILNNFSRFDIPFIPCTTTTARDIVKEYIQKQ